MPHPSSIGSTSWTPTATNFVTSFYTQQPLLAVTGAIVLPLLGIIGLLYLRSNYRSIEDQIEDFIASHELWDAHGLVKKVAHPPKQDELYDKISISAIHLGHPILSENSADSIKDIDKKNYSICRLFNHYHHEGNLYQAKQTALSIHENEKLKNELLEKVFLGVLQMERFVDAYEVLSSYLSTAPKRNSFCKTLFEACVDGDDSATAKKVAQFMNDSPMRAEYFKKHSDKWGAS